MTINQLIKQIEKCYDKKQQAFYADIPAELGVDILSKLKELQNVRSESNEP